SAVRAERWTGSARGSQNGLLLFSERGVGVGIFVKGEPIEGARNMAGEFGHLTVESEAEDRCECGKRGCVEAIASSPNIIRQYARSSGRRASDLRITDVFEKVRQKDPGAVAVIDRACRALGLAVSHAINLLNPEILILGGDLALGEDILLPRIAKEAARHALPELMKGLQITASLLGSDMRLKGAGALAFQKSLTDPELLKKMCSPLHLRQGRLEASGKRSNATRETRQSPESSSRGTVL
ncbi:MAG: ROK family protein, partial [Acidobacteria bacterium]|nr:ROK family protein [Acidobacteriota bacterium]